MSALIRLPVRQGTDEWLEARRTGVTASMLPVITGNKPGLLELWAEQCGLAGPEVPDAATQEMYDLGHALEPVIADAYTRKYGRPLKRVDHMVRHPDIEWAYASLDRVSAVKGERRIIELKANLARRWDDGPEPVPAAVQDQVQWQLFVTGWPVADVAVLQGFRVEAHEVAADAAYQETLRQLAEWFRGLVLRQERPPIDGTESSRRALTRMYPHGDGEVITDPPTELDDMVRLLHRQRATAKAAIDAEATTENAIRALLADAAGVEGRGYRISYRQNKASARTDWKAVAEDLAPRVDAHVWGDVVAGRTATQEGPRVLRVTFKEEASSWL